MKQLKEKEKEIGEKETWQAKSANKIKKTWNVWESHKSLIRGQGRKGRERVLDQLSYVLILQNEKSNSECLDLNRRW